VTKDTLPSGKPEDALGGRAPKKDSLRAGKTEAAGIVLAGKQGIGLTFTFMIPIVRGLELLRSADENSPENTHMLQDATNRFDDNDIAWPLGVAFAWRPNAAVGLRAEAVYFQTSNSNKWTPGDTTYLSPHVNSYALKALQMSVDVQFNFDPAFLSADNFQRLYVSVGADAAPLVFLSTERTLLNKKIKSRGYGFSATLCAGLERYLTERTSLAGELGYCLGSWGNFNDNGARIRISDVERSGSGDAYSLALRALKLRFSFFRWF
jgi:hypothetical protein